MGVSDQISSLVFVLLIVQVTRHLDLANPSNLLALRITYGLSQLFLLGVSFYALRRIRKLADKTKLQVPEPAKPFTNEPATVKEITVEEYDVEKVKEYIKQTVFSCLFLLFLHYKYEFLQPLLIQSILPLKAAFFLPIFQIHVFGKLAEGDLKRPFKPPANPFADLLNENQNQNQDETKLTKSEKKKLKKLQAASTDIKSDDEKKED